MTVAEELRNRGNCRYKLRGVRVAVDGTGESLWVSHTYWDGQRQLVVVLDDGTKLPAERCHLRSRWPVACCLPERRNEWNSVGRKWYR
jgi:hypothetical protein